MCVINVCVYVYTSSYDRLNILHLSYYWIVVLYARRIMCVHAYCMYINAIYPIVAGQVNFVFICLFIYLLYADVRERKAKRSTA